jgi:hypothetical protein
VPHAQQPPDHSQESLSQRILRASDADQLAYLHARMNQGLRPVDDDAVSTLLFRSSLVLPIIERRIEEVLRSGNPQECFTDKAAVPKYFVDVGAGLIAEVGDEYAMREIAKLVAVDEKRFGPLVIDVLVNAQDRGNPFAVAYKGFDIGDPRVDKQIVAWASHEFEDETAFWQGKLKHWWAEAMVEKYRVPLDMHWHDDPLASRIDRQLADSLHDDIFRLAAEARDRQAKK